MAHAVAVWWVKRDARLADNACLVEADRRGMDLLPLFCVEPSIDSASDTSDMHRHAQWQAVHGLRSSLRTHNADVVIGHGEIVEKLAKLHAIVPLTAVFAHEEIGNDLTYRRDRAVATWCRERGIEYREFPQSSVRRGGVNRDHLQRMWQSRIVETAPLAITPIRQADHWRKLAAATTFPHSPAYAIREEWQPTSERDAQKTLREFLTTRGRRYRGGISSPNTAFTAGR
jgi:deoxyribodipyrimidine photo-lyase